MSARTVVLVGLGLLMLSCDRAPVQPPTTLAGPLASTSEATSIVDSVIITPDAAPGTNVARGACLSFHAKVWSRDSAKYLPNQPVDWYAIGIPVSFDNAGDFAPSQVTRNSSQAVLVCGTQEGFGAFRVVSDGVPGRPSQWNVDVGSPVQTLTIGGPTRMHDNQSSAQLDAWAVDQWGTGRDLTAKAVWSTNDATVISLSKVGSQEWATQHKIGTATISATVYGKTAQLVIKVLGVASVDLGPANPSVHVGNAVTLTATPRDEEGVAFTGKAVTWTTSDTAVAKVSNGIVTGVRYGQATISAWVDGIQGSTTVTVFTDYVSGYYPTSLSGAPTPITSGGTYSLTPTTSTQGTPPVTYKWEVTYSNGVLPPQVTGFVPGSYNLQVPDGNYKITVTVTPRQLYGTGYPTAFTYPVCTGAAQPAAGVQPSAKIRLAKRPATQPDVHEQVVAGCNKPPPV